MAAQAVFGTVELLENIILYVPAHQIHLLKGVSKFCDELVRTSSFVRRLRCLTPTFQFMDQVLLYDIETAPRLHPSLYSIGKHVECKSTEVVLTKLMFTRGSMPALERYKGIYPSNPRCEALRVSLHGLGTHDKNECTIYAKGGIKMDDFLKVCTKLRRANLLQLFDGRSIPSVLESGIPYEREYDNATDIRLQLAHFREGIR